MSFEREQLLIPGRRFRFDFVITGSDLVIEVEAAPGLAVGIRAALAFDRTASSTTRRSSLAIGCCGIRRIW